jgi:hypothetical protein
MPQVEALTSHCHGPSALWFLGIRRHWRGFEINAGTSEAFSAANLVNFGDANARLISRSRPDLRSRRPQIVVSPFK